MPANTTCDAAELERVTAALHATMEQKDIPYVEDMLEMAQLEGVRFLACKTSADLFDLGPDAFIPGVQTMVAEDFLKLATASDLQLVL